MYDAYLFYSAVQWALCKTINLTLIQHSRLKKWQCLGVVNGFSSTKKPSVKHKKGETVSATQWKQDNENDVGKDNDDHRSDSENQSERRFHFYLAESSPKCKPIIRYQYCANLYTILHLCRYFCTGKPTLGHFRKIESGPIISYQYLAILDNNFHFFIVFGPANRHWATLE